MVVLKEARNVKYSKFVEPGQTLTVTAEWLERSEQEVKFKAYGEVDGEQAVSARLTLATYNLAETDADKGLTDEVIRQKLREFHSLVDRGRVAV
jgi:hypothetical protein